jgi:hypothetical protein
MAMDPVTEMEMLVDLFAAEGIEYALCGGLALAVHGHPRATKDIDILIERTTLPRALAVAKRAGFDIPARKMTFGLKTGTPRDVQRVSKLDDATGKLLTLNLLLVSPDLEEVWNTRQLVEADQRRITVVSREGLATMKRIAGRPQDLVDLAKLEGTDEPDEG